MSTTASTTAFTAVDVELYQAIANGDLNAFTNALRNGANPNAAYSGWNPLTLAMHHLEGRCVPFVHALVQAQADVNQPERASGSDRTPLLFALNGGSFEVTKLLLDHGANPSTPDREGNTPLKLVESKGDPLLAALLGSAFVERKDGNTSTPAELDLALELLTGSLTSIASCVGAQGQTEHHEVDQHQAGDGETGLELSDDLEARFSRLLDACANGDLVQVQALVVNHEDDLLKLQLDDGRDALHFAAAGGHGPVVQHLVDHGADLEAEAHHRPEGPHTPLDLARVLDHPDAVAVLERACEEQGVQYGEHRSMVATEGPDGTLHVRVLNKYTRQAIDGTVAERLAEQAVARHAQQKAQAQAQAAAQTVSTQAAEPASAPAVPVSEADVAPAPAPAPMVNDLVTTSSNVAPLATEQSRDAGEWAPATFIGRWAQRRMEKQAARQAERAAKALADGQAGTERKG